MAARRIRGDGAMFQRHDHPSCPEPVDGRRAKHKCLGTWVARVDLGWIGGKHVRREVSGKTKTAVAARLRDVKREVEAGVTSGAMTTGSWLDHWLDQIAARKVRDRTMVGYRGYAEKWIKPNVGRVRLDRLTPEHVRGMHKAMRDAGKSEATVRQAHMILRRALVVAEREGKVMRNVAALVDAPSASVKTHAALELADARRLLKWADGQPARTRVRLACAVMLGLRQGEALGLDWREVDLDAGEVEVRQALARINNDGLRIGPVKSMASHRRVPMDPATLQAFRDLRSEVTGVGLVFGGDRPTDPRRDWQAWKDALVAADCPDVPLHGARAACASIHDALGHSPRLVADLLGHAAVTVTQKHYARSYDDQRRAAVESMAKVLDR